jgi:thiamine phosphate synthase YjbQ (UPF0047 family)
MGAGSVGPIERDRRTRQFLRNGSQREVVVDVTKGKLDFGPWERIFYGEFDGRRDKRILIKIIGE